MPKDESAKVEQWSEFYEELQQESERGGVLLGAEFLNEHLRLLISAFLINDPSAVKQLINGPLGSFGARINAAYCLGLVSQEEFNDLQNISGVRNLFAHRLQGLSFKDKDVIRYCAELVSPNKLPVANAPKERFLTAAALLASRLKLRTLQAKRERRTKKPDVQTVS